MRYMRNMEYNDNMTIYRGINSVSGGNAVATADLIAATAAEAAVSAEAAFDSAAAALVSEGLADADATATAADVVLTNADVVLTNADVVTTNADVVLTGADAATADAAKVAAQSAQTATELVYDNFDDRYLGAKASDPTLDNDGDPLLVGALVFNTTTGSMRVYDGAVWADTASSISGLFQTFTYTATASQTVFNGADDNALSMAFDNDTSLQVFLNGVKLIKTTDYIPDDFTDTLTLTVGATASDLLEVSAFSYFQLSDTYTQAQIDAKDATKQDSDADIPTVVVSQVEAEAGTSTANRTFTPERVKQAIASLGFPVGSVVASILGVLEGTLECDGSAVSRTTYAALFAIAGTTYGVGDGSTTFNLPDLRGEFMRGFDNGRGVDTSRVEGSTQAELLAAHTHNVGQGFSANSTGGTVQGVGAGGNVVSASTGGAENRPRNIAMRYCVKY